MIDSKFPGYVFLLGIGELHKESQSENMYTFSPGPCKDEYYSNNYTELKAQIGEGVIHGPAIMYMNCAILTDVTSRRRFQFVNVFTLSCHGCGRQYALHHVAKRSR